MQCTCEANKCRSQIGKDTQKKKKNVSNTCMAHPRALLDACAVTAVFSLSVAAPFYLRSADASHSAAAAALLDGGLGYVALLYGMARALLHNVAPLSFDAYIASAVGLNAGVALSAAFTADAGGSSLGTPVNIGSAHRGSVFDALRVLAVRVLCERCLRARRAQGASPLDALIDTDVRVVYALGSCTALCAGVLHNMRDAAGSALFALVVVAVHFALGACAAPHACRGAMRVFGVRSGLYYCMLLLMCVCDLYFSHNPGPSFFIVDLFGLYIKFFSIFLLFPNFVAFSFPALNAWCLCAQTKYRVWRMVGMLKKGNYKSVKSAAAGLVELMGGGGSLIMRAATLRARGVEDLEAHWREGVAAVPLLVHALAAHNGSVEVCAAACGALGYLAGCDAGRTACLRAGAPLAIVAALTAHEGAAGVCEAACWALHNVAVNLAGKTACLSVGAPPAIVAALTAHVGLTGVCEAACGALRNVAYSNEGEAACLSAGAHPAIVSALTAHVGVMEMCVAACLALRNVAGSDAGEAACLSAGAPLAIVAALTAHAGVADVCGEACWALGKVARSDAGRAACLSAGAPPAIVAALTAHAGVADVCVGACLALYYVARSDEGRAACLSAGAPSAIVAAFNARVGHVGNVAMCMAACEALGNLALSDAGRAACLSAGGPLAFVAALRRHPGDSFVRMLVCDALCRIAGSATGRAACVAAGAVEVLHALIEAAPERDRDDLQRALDHISPPVPSALLLLALPPAELAARLASCLPCWLSAPRPACAHGAPHDPCPICFEADLPDAPWMALRCGHLVHARCMMGWASSETHHARAASAALPRGTAAHCPFDRCVATRIALAGTAAAEGEVVVATPAV